MNKRLLLITAFLFLIVHSLSAQRSDDTSAIEALLIEFLDGASVNDSEIHERFWAEDLIYTSSSGQRYGKPEIMDDIKNSPSQTDSEPSITYSAEDIRIRIYGHTAILAFRLIGKTETDTLQYLNSGTFLKRNDIWKAVNWQATRIPD